LVWIQHEMNDVILQNKQQPSDDDDGRMIYYQVGLTRMDPWECSPKNDILLGWVSTSSSATSSSLDSSTNNGLSSPYGSISKQDDYPKCQDCFQDMEATIHHLFSTTTTTTKEEDDDALLEDDTQQQQQQQHDQVDWTKEEEKEIHTLLSQFVQQVETIQQTTYNSNPHNEQRQPNEQHSTTDNNNLHSLNVIIEKDESSQNETGRIIYKLPKGMGKRKRKLVHYIAEQLKLIHWSEGKKVADKIVVVAKRI